MKHLVLALALPVCLQETPEAPDLVEQGWTLVPQYTGEHRWFLTEDEARATRAGVHLFAAAVELEPESTRALWSLAHANALLAEDARNRGEDERAETWSLAASEALDRSIELDASDPWAFYARGVELANTGRPDRAVSDLERAVANCEAAEDRDDFAWLRFKCLEWRAEALMRGGRFEEARAALTSFHEEFSENAWPKHIALAENALRARELGAARAEYDAILEAFPDDHQAYALLGYLAGLLGDREEATRRLEQARQREGFADFYIRLWAHLLATAEAEQATRAELAGFLENPPANLSDWDATLGRFVLERGDVDAFLARVAEERQARMAAGVSLDDLECEAWFYVGMRHELAAAELEDEEARRVSFDRAVRAYERALSFRPRAWKWEWAFARRRFANLCAELERSPVVPFRIVAERFEDDHVSGSILEARWHTPGAPGPSARPNSLRPGDLLLLRLLEDGADVVRVLRTIGAR